MTSDEKFDHVQAYHCDQLPKECKFMFNRPRPGHWPRPDTLVRARQTGVFLVPQGYTESPSKQTMSRSTAFMVPSKLTSYPYSKWQWRFSTSLMERFLIFDFSPVQVKVYTLTKIIRKTFLKPVFGDRFSTFHIKTAMMFTIENYPLDIWREDNIVQCSTSGSQSDIDLGVVSLLTPFLHNTLASMLASRCIYLGQPITQDIFNWYQQSLDSDCMSSRLKFASMLYCRGQYDEAAEVLTYCEGLLGPEVWQYCTHRERKCLSPSTEFKTKLVFCPPNEMHKKYTMVCLVFRKEEINCIPQHLTYGMFRDEDIPIWYKWKNNVVIDCIPFLYYLQHLTYRELHKPLRAQTALLHLHEYTIGPPKGHIDTTFNMLGHCFELQNRLDQAWMCYGRSLDIYDRDNVSLLHLARLFHQVFM
ncbi:uncharacterized protein LOC128207840 [Mya arenaria]|uniref:uncharacterized protein LOC128207840 n=1 Tax=Mya arenaria TaxID=6604 RepID=UPI0022E87BA7|nr:uncharacterized protein LOC128207840 [Mya arenaria]